MRTRFAFGIKALISCVVFNSMLLVAVYWVAQRLLRGFHQWFDPFVADKGADLPADMRLVIDNVVQWLAQLEHYLALAVFGAGALITLVLWLFILGHGRRLEKSCLKEVRETLPAETTASAQAVTPSEEPVRFVQKAPEAAVQMLAILQRQGRLIDFLQENLSLYEDAQIGAAVRSVHAGCKQAIEEHVRLTPVYEAEEGTQITVESGFDAAATRLIGAVSGQPPFTGVLRHRGWRVENVELPQLTPGQGKGWVLAPAEIEVG
ncbi:MAG TPA: DUF2760 domain-containing protein [Syntrophobacteraceae bacterium]|nr:DUF2760 domain-containing protein [Syntrophobacteraceae bacterium]HBD08199.1 DUF2760 domain-containing protein [Syntrophobacteraceae bacterium]